ncbi:MAG: shikimate kinase [Pseudomonadales bacterium]|jgi:shikimate kinase|nr:shikimate kinase [Pseudomonadales bacterium]
MPTLPTNIVLIGMPGAGKSTLGVILAKRTSRAFVDTDLLIQNSQNKTLQNIIDNKGYIALRRIEQDALLNLDAENTVIATGGSAVYSASAMEHLKKNGKVIFLDVSLPVLQKRIGDFSERGIAMDTHQSFSDLFAERSALYCQFADARIDCAGRSQEEICVEIIRRIS